MVIAIYDKYGRYFRVNKKTTVWFGVERIRLPQWLSGWLSVAKKSSPQFGGEDI
jgi:hypothetical protein